MNYYTPFSPSVPLQQRLAMMEQMQSQYPQQNYMQNYMSPQQSPMSNYPQSYQQPVATQPPAAPVLQGEVVSDYETVKAMRANLDGSISYYPSTDGEVIYTKSLNPDGSSNIRAYRSTPIQQESSHVNGEELNSRLASIEGKLEQLFNVFMGTEPEVS